MKLTKPGQLRSFAAYPRCSTDVNRMATEPTNAALEFHDSWLTSIAREGNTCTLVLDAFVHRSSGIAAVAAGTVWSQRVELRCAGARVATPLPEPLLPIQLADGVLSIRERRFENVVPLPTGLSDQVHVELVAATGERMVVDAASAEVVLTGEARYVEEFPGSQD